MEEVEGLKVSEIVALSRKGYTRKGDGDLTLLPPDYKVRKWSKRPVSVGTMKLSAWVPHVKDRTPLPQAYMDTILAKTLSDVGEGKGRGEEGLVRRQSRRLKGPVSYREDGDEMFESLDDTPSAPQEGEQEEEVQVPRQPRKVASTELRHDANMRSLVSKGIKLYDLYRTEVNQAALLNKIRDTFQDTDFLPHNTLTPSTLSLCKNGTYVMWNEWTFIMYLFYFVVDFSNRKVDIHKKMFTGLGKGEEESTRERLVGDMEDSIEKMLSDDMRRKICVLLKRPGVEPDDTVLDATTLAPPREPTTDAMEQ